MIRVWLSLAVVMCCLALAAWSTDFITPQGERTIYSVACKDGTWTGRTCSGKLVPAERYRFRTLRAHEEVLFWTIGASGPSHKYSNCKVQDGRNWVCPPSPDANRTITRQMRLGEPVADASVPTKPYRGVSKWRWLLLESGLPAGSSAD